MFININKKISESLTLQQLKDLKEIARQLGATSMGSAPVSNTGISDTKIENVMNSINSDGTEFNGTSNTASNVQSGSTLDTLLGTLESRLEILENQDGPSGMSPCSEGTYSAAGMAGCTPCDAGKKLIDAATGDESIACQNCGAGTYSAASVNNCTPCAEGTYSLEGSSACEPCAAGTWSAEGSSECA